MIITILSISTNTFIARALQEIRRFQRTHDLLLPKAPFARLVREITNDLGPGLRFQKNALEALQEAAESFLVSMFEGEYHKDYYKSPLTVFRYKSLCDSCKACHNPKQGCAIGEAIETGLRKHRPRCM